MSLDLSGAPAEVRALANGLSRAGFKVVDELGSGTVDRRIELRHGNLSIRITADRGEWWIDLGSASFDDWFDPDVWKSCLDSEPIAMEPSEFEDGSAFVLGRWREVVQAIDEGGTINGCLDNARSTRARARLGLPLADED